MSESALLDADGDAIERAIAGALKSAIHDHGPLTPELIGSAVKRILGNLQDVGLAVVDGDTEVDAPPTVDDDDDVNPPELRLTPEELARFRKASIRHYFKDSGLHYYVAGRFSFLAGQQQPVCAILLHHAVEMFLKGALCQTMELKQVGKPKHRLRKLWTWFKRAFADQELSSHDRALLDLDPFYKLRYPDSPVKDGMDIAFSPGSRADGEMASSPSRGSLYSIYLADIDALVAGILEASGQGRRSVLTDRALAVLNEGNAHPWTALRG